ncbi:MAG: molybdopterin-dependent oxidoreductase, partial [Hyphomicrobium sp.]
HVADGLRTQRLDSPYIRKDGRLAPASWSDALALVATKLKAAAPDRIGAIAGDLAGAEEMFALKDLMQRLGTANIDCRQAGDKLDPKLGRASYVFNTTIDGIEQADAILIVGSIPRIEAPVLNARIRKRWLRGGLTVGVVAPAHPLTYKSEHLGADPAVLADIASGRHPFAATLKAAQRPMVVVGEGGFTRHDGLAILSLAARIALHASAGKDAAWNAFNVLHTAAARVAGLDLGFVPGKGGLAADAMAKSDALDVLYLLGADEIALPKSGSAFVIYQGSHGDAGAAHADVVLPGAAYTEKSVTYVNTEGRAQQTSKAAFAPGAAKEDWTIIRALSPLAGHTLPYDDLGELRAAMYKAAPQLAAIDAVETRAMASLETLAKLSGAPSADPFRATIADFYLTNPVARASAVMAGLSALRASTADKTLKAAE